MADGSISSRKLSYRLVLASGACVSCKVVSTESGTQHETRAKYIHKLLATERAITVLLRVSHDA
jgi:hypothetical protein